MREDEVYVATKNWFKKNGFIALAGQPPNGCDNIPTIEIKDLANTSKGSKGSFKPDLVFANNNYLILVECKPLDDSDDENKLLEVDSNRDRQKLLFEELSQRGIFERRALNKSFPDLATIGEKLRYCLAHNGAPRVMDKVFSLKVVSMRGDGEITEARNPQYNIDY